jgi:S1-C subfamily serine protease
MIQFSCPPCKKVLKVAPEHGGKKLSCPGCGQRLQVPAAMPARNKTILGSSLPETASHSATASSRPAAAQPANAAWYYLHNGKQQGPVTLAVLQDLTRAGRLKSADLVWTAGMNKWVAAQTIPAIFAAPELSAPQAPASLLSFKPAPDLSVPARARGRSSWRRIAIGLGLACSAAALALVFFLGKPFANNTTETQVAQANTPVQVNPASVARKETPSRGAEEINNRELREKTRLGCVAVYATGDIGPASGWIVDAKKKWVITNWHVVRSFETVEVMFPAYEGKKLIRDQQYYMTKAKRFPAKVLSLDSERDLALIELASMPANVAELRLANASAEEGDLVHLIGNASVNQALWGYASGKVRMVERQKKTFPDQTIDALTGLTDMATNGGDSGAPVVNNKGEVVGVNSWGATPIAGGHVMGYIDVSELKAFLKAPHNASLQSQKKALFSQASSLGNQLAVVLNDHVRICDQAKANFRDPKSALEQLMKKDQELLQQLQVGLKNLRTAVDNLPADLKTPAEVRQKLTALVSHCEQMKGHLDIALTYSGPYTQYADEAYNKVSHFNQLVAQLKGILGNP